MRSAAEGDVREATVVERKQSGLRQNPSAHERTVRRPPS